MQKFLCFLFLLVVAGCAAGTPQINQANPDVDMTDALNKLSYAAGYQLGDMFQNQKLTLVPEAVVKGMYEARKNIRPALTKAQMKVMLRDPKAFLMSEADVQIANTVQGGETFLQTNALRAGVVELPSGVQYEVLQEGQGGAPMPADRVKINYTGKQINGDVFDSNAATGEPAEFAMQSLVPGLIEGLQLMRTGGKSIFYIPSHLAYGSRGPLARKTVLFEIELVEVIPAQ